MRTIRKKYYILDIGNAMYNGVIFTGEEYIISRSRNNAAIKAAINFLKEVL